MSNAHTLSRQAHNLAVGIVLASAVAWAFWWYPVRLIEVTGASGAWTGTVMSAAALVLCLPLLVILPGRVSSRAILGTLLIGVAVMLYTISVSYTVFIRAVLIFYIAPAWSLMIECTFLGRRWTLRALASIAGSFIGLGLISRGDISFEGIGAIGDWMALIAGMAWSAGAAFLFTSKHADFGWTIVLTLVGSTLVGLGLIAAFGDTFGSPPGAALWENSGIWSCVIGGAFLAFILGCTMWGAIRLPPTVMSFLLSVEIICGVAVSATILGEPFGAYEFFGALFVIGAVTLELTRTRDANETTS